MSIDYYSCTICGEAFPDVVDYGHCGNCENVLCADCRDRMGEKYGVLGGEHENADDYGEDAPLHCNECISETYTIEEKIDRLLLSLNEEEKEILHKKLTK